MSADWELQVAIKGVLADYQPLIDTLAEGADSIKDHPRQGTPYPYLVIGDAQETNDDDKDTVRSSFSVTIHCWSDYAGRKVVKEVLGHVKKALHLEDIPMAGGFKCVDCQFELSESFVEPDGKTRHGVITFDVDVEEA